MEDYKLLRKKKPNEFRQLNVFNDSSLELYITKDIDMLLNEYKNQNCYCTDVVVGIYYKVSASDTETFEEIIEIEDYYDLYSLYEAEIEDFEKEDKLLELEEEIISDVETVECEKDLYIGDIKIPEGSTVRVMGIEAYIYGLNIM